MSSPSASWRIVPAAPAHIGPIAANMRDIDRREVWAADRHTPEEALETSLAASALAWTCLVDGAPAFMWGVAARPEAPLVGIPWFLATPRCQLVRLAFASRSRAFVNRMQRGFTRLENFVHAENRVSIRWLEWCGFTVGKSRPVYFNGETFFYFHRDKEASPCVKS